MTMLPGDESRAVLAGADMDRLRRSLDAAREALERVSSLATDTTWDGVVARRVFEECARQRRAVLLGLDALQEAADTVSARARHPLSCPPRRSPG